MPTVAALGRPPPPSSGWVRALPSAPAVGVELELETVPGVCVAGCTSSVEGGEVSALAEVSLVGVGSNVGLSMSGVSDVTEVIRVEGALVIALIRMVVDGSGSAVVDGSGSAVVNDSGSAVVDVSAVLSVAVAVGGGDGVDPSADVSPFVGAPLSVGVSRAVVVSLSAEVSRSVEVSPSDVSSASSAEVVVDLAGTVVDSVFSIVEVGVA